MKYANVNGVKTHAKTVRSATKGNDLWYQEYEVVACVGKYRQYWKYTGAEPPYPNGYENESEWHAAWKTAIRDEHCEVVCGENREHRADIKTHKYIIEIQKSSMDGYDVIERNKFYKELTGNRLVWVVNLEKPWKEKKITTEYDYKSKDGRFIITWKYAWKWVKEIAAPKDTFLFLDFNTKGERLIYMWMHDKVLYGKWVFKLDFYKTYLKDVMKPEYSINDELLNIFKDLD